MFASNIRLGVLLTGTTRAHGLDAVHSAARLRSVSHNVLTQYSLRASCVPISFLRWLKSARTLPQDHNTVNNRLEGL